MWFVSLCIISTSSPVHDTACIKPIRVVEGYESVFRHQWPIQKAKRYKGVRLESRLSNTGEETSVFCLLLKYLLIIHTIFLTKKSAAIHSGIKRDGERGREKESVV